MSDIDKTLAERGNRYGEFPEHASITQGIKNAMSTGRNWGSMDDDKKEALEMVAHKIGRILNGDPDYIDSWTDIIGYTRLVEKRLIDEQQSAKVVAFPHQAAVEKAFPKAGVFKAEVEAYKAKAEKLSGKSSGECNCIMCVIERQASAKFQKRA